MGINQTTSTAVQHGPPHLGGMDVFVLDTAQGIHQTKMIIAHLRQQDDEVGNMLSISLDHLQLQAGVSWPVLSQPGHLQCHYIYKCYLSMTWEFLDDIDTTIGTDKQNWIVPQCISDSFIMEELSTLPRIKPIDLTHAQQCQLYLGITTTVANISNSNGKDISEWALNGNDAPHHPSYIYPRQAKPASSIWATWHRLL
jgi:hypothetical protein